MAVFKQCTCPQEGRSIEDLAHCIKGWMGPGSMLLFAPPGGGKDEGGARIAARIDGVVIGAGKLLRQQKAEGSLDAAAAGFMDSGGLIGTSFFEQVTLPEINRPDYAGKPLVLTAVGRKNPEHLTVHPALQEAGHPLRVVVLIDVPLEEAIRRLTSEPPEGAVVAREVRADDTAQALPTRFRAFRDETGPVLAYYGEQDLLVRIDGVGTMEDVEWRTLEAIHEFAYSETR